MLLKAGADINVQNQYGKIALSAAIMRRNEKMIKILLDNGAKFEIVWQAASPAWHDKMMRKLRQYDPAFRQKSPVLEGV